MKKIKIRGITGMPLFLTRLHGYFDGKRGAVALQAGIWTGHYIEKKQAIYHAYLNAEYRRLEVETAPLHRESATLAVEYEEKQIRFAEEDKEVTASTASEYERLSAAQAEVKPNLRSRIEEIQIRLAAIDEMLTQAVNETAAIQREADSMVVRRIQAYLHGASLAARCVKEKTQYQVVTAFDCEKDYLERHKWNDETRRNILKKAYGGGTE